jgi:hypothetical protein
MFRMFSFRIHLLYRVCLSSVRNMQIFRRLINLRSYPQMRGQPPIGHLRLLRQSFCISHETAGKITLLFQIINCSTKDCELNCRKHLQNCIDSYLIMNNIFIYLYSPGLLLCFLVYFIGSCILV